MAVTGQLSPAEKKYLFRQKLYQEYNELFFFTGAQGQGDACIEKIDELTRNKKGEEAAYFALIPNIVGGGIINDNTMRHRERKVDAAWQKVNYSCFANAVVNKGPASDQKSLIQLRNIQKSVLGKWLARSNEEQAVLTASGISYAFNLDGSRRQTPDGQDDWTSLDYEADIRAPSANRHFRWDATSGLVAGDTTAVDPADKAAYGLLPELKGVLNDKRIAPTRVGGRDVHIILAPTKVMTALWRDDEFKRSIVQAGERGSKNALEKFGHFTMHDLLVVPYAGCYHNKNAAAGEKWGAAGDVNGARILALGAQALARADLGAPEWLEQTDDYGRVTGFGIEHFGGWLKPQFPSSYDGGSVEDYGIAACDVAI